MPAAWWQVRPDELAARFGWNADALMDALNPEDFTDEQATLAVTAIACCHGELPALAIRIDPEVHQILRERVGLSSDTPNGLLRQLLGLAGRRSSSPSQRASRGTPPRWARKVTLLPLDRYRLPLLQALVAGGGSLPAREALEAVEAALAAELTPGDKEPLQSGTPRWRDRVYHARLRLTVQGLIEKDTRWGVWTITQEGRGALINSGGQGDE